ncbi:VENN motif pre-toxin domain-containing protein, partial [Escherichia coli]
NESQKQDIAGLSRDPENANGSIAPIFDREKEQKRLQEAQVISQISGQMSNIVMTYGETEAMKAARAKHPGLSDAQLRETPEYREVMKGYGTGSTPQMVVQAITGVLGGLNAGNPGQVLAGGLNPAVAQLIKQATDDNREANLMAHAVWGALAAQLGGNNAASGAAGAFSGELAARYIIDNYYGGRTDNLSEQERQQISMLATIASGIAGGLAGNSTSAAGTGAQAGRNSAENNMLNVIATETAANTAAAIAGATGNASKDTGNDNSWDTGGGCEGSREQCAVRDPSRDGTRGPGHVLNGDNTDENKQPNLGKDVASATDKDKAELGGAGAGTPGGWGPDNEEKARHQEVQQQRFDELSKIYDKSHPAGELTVDGQTIRQSSVSNRYGTTKVFESQTLTDKQIHNYAQQLAGDTPLKEVKSGIYTSKLSDGSVITLRNISTSEGQTGARWTIDIRNNQKLTELGNKYSRVEIKFK